ncbi:MAG TPA: T9SS type A sorting domain-containing protein [Chitinophagales bacterium]
MKKILLGVCATFALYTSNAQDCLERYKDEIFNSVTVTTRTYSTTNQLMDIYTPNGDTATSRPVAVWIHGGTFVSGSKTDADVVVLCNNFAKRGYVTASINYSLTSIINILDSTTAIPPVMKAVMEAKAAVRYLRLDSNATTFGIDTSIIFIGGSSAGGVLAVNYAFLDTVSKATPLLLSAVSAYADTNGAYGYDTLEGNLGNPGPSSHVQGVVSLAGGILYTNWIDGKTNIPVVLCQGTDDNVVPFDCGQVEGGASDIVLCGSNAMSAALCTANIPFARYDFQGAQHVPWDANNAVNDSMTILDSLTANFLFNYVPHSTCSGIPAFNCNPTGIKTIENDRLLNVYPNPAQNVLNISVENNAAEIKTVRIFNVLGQTAYNGNETKISTQAMQNGIYFVEVTFNDNQRAVKRVEVLK